MDEPMEIGEALEHWVETEMHEHKAMELLMVNLGIIDDMEVGEMIDVKDDELQVDMAFDEEMEHNYLDRILEEMEVGDAAGDNLDNILGKDNIESVAGGSLHINIQAYKNTGTWWLNNWVTNTTTQVELQLPPCKNMLGCACSLTDLGNMEDTRIIHPASWDCTMGRINYKRGRKEQIVWSKNSRSKRGSLPRKC